MFVPLPLLIAIGIIVVLLVVMLAVETLDRGPTIKDLDKAWRDYEMARTKMTAILGEYRRKQRRKQ